MKCFSQNGNRRCQRFADFFKNLDATIMRTVSGVKKRYKRACIDQDHFLCLLLMTSATALFAVFAGARA